MDIQRADSSIHESLEFKEKYEKSISWYKGIAKISCCLSNFTAKKCF